MPDPIARVQQLLETPPDLVVPVPGTAFQVGADLEGDPSGVPVMFVHGTPDSRLARHPDPTVVADLGVRLVAVDRPGFGHSTADPAASPTGWATSVTAVLDHLGLDTAHLLAWSAGTIWALGVAAAAPDRVRSVTAVGGLVPFEAFDDPGLRDAAGDTRTGMIETAEELGAQAAAELIAPLLVPNPATPAAAWEHRREVGDADLARLPGAEVRMAAAVCDAVRGGPAGLVHEVQVQLSPSGVPLGDLAVPSRFVTGTDDQICPPAFAHWYAARIAGAEVEIMEGAGHGLPITHWRMILESILQR